MQLKYTKSIKKRVISIELETTGFTTNETKALDLFGEPEVVLEKTYAGGFPISINKKIRTGFKVKAKFDGTDNMDGAAKAANDFFDEIKEKLGIAMGAAMEQLDSSEFEPETGTFAVDY